MYHVVTMLRRLNMVADIENGPVYLEIHDDGSGFFRYKDIKGNWDEFIDVAEMNEIFKRELGDAWIPAL